MISQLPEEDAIHVYLLPVEGDLDISFTVNASTFATEPHYGRIDIWHFDQRILKYYSSDVTDEEGKFLLEMLAPHPKVSLFVVLQMAAIVCHVCCI